MDKFAGQLGCAWHETDVDDADRATPIRDLLNLVPMSENNKPLQSLGCDTGRRRPALRPRLPLDRVVAASSIYDVKVLPVLG
ncbi:hypothetical protein ONR75_30520 [Rhodopseudomonas sp. P2A-2r]|uniref:hypothetical protein n=1 Tax=Rhodopseudomonas sp. P2A-2r TaxID=2991972 RepID=UPI002234275D|nr:hypothetical protein [Rhodopseudomonas sp. P2A-2r]UZE52414.1 hypothetical protein ONR75_30520 [Rhodopseudomonas sp. P2A-2r]